MYNIGDMVVYGMRGVFEITDIREERVLGEDHKYYVMKSLHERADSLVFVPVDNEQLVSEMRYPLTREEADKIIEEIPSIEPADYIKDSRTRTDTYRKLIESGEHRKLIAVIKAVWQNSELRKKEGKKSYISDDNTLKRAEALLYSEFSLVLGISEEEVVEYITRACEA